MAIQFYDINNKDRIIFEIIENNYNLFFKIIEKFNERYNYLFDLYGDFRLHTNHIDFLIDEIKKEKSTKIFGEFLTFLEMANLNKINIYVVGD
jgi:hypothetical protein